MVGETAHGVVSRFTQHCTKKLSVSELYYYSHCASKLDFEFCYSNNLELVLGLLNTVMTYTMHIYRAKKLSTNKKLHHVFLH